MTKILKKGDKVEITFKIKSHVEKNAWDDTLNNFIGAEFVLDEFTENGWIFKTKIRTWVIPEDCLELVEEESEEKSPERTFGNCSNYDQKTCGYVPDDFCSGCQKYKEKQTKTIEEAMEKVVEKHSDRIEKFKESQKEIKPIQTETLYEVEYNKKKYRIKTLNGKFSYFLDCNSNRVEFNSDNLSLIEFIIQKIKQIEKQESADVK
jgi:hypothetical protein